MNRLFLLVFISTIGLTASIAKESVVGGPCQGCELVFVDMPRQLHNHSTIASKNEEGDALKLVGIVTYANGNPASSIIVYAYQTDNRGVYPKGETVHGQLRGWAITNNEGEYSFATIRPKAYPGRDTPQHIHMHVIEPNKGTYYIDDLTFNDDPLITAKHRNKQNCRGGCGLNQPARNEYGNWVIQRDIVLGEAIPDY